MSVVKKIVVTGGPCGGKTSSKSAILEAVLKAGYIPIFIGETATEVKLSGLDPVAGMLSVLDFQRFLSKLQIAKEDTYLEELEKSDKKFVVFFDRGLIDNKAYVDEYTWKKLLNQLNLTDVEIFRRYDLVLHLVSAADGAESYYTTENNVARGETLEEAKTQEKKNKEAYNGFPYIYYFENETSFEEKINRVVGTVMSSICMGKPILGSQRKFIVPKVDIKNLEKLKAQSAVIEQCYLNNDKNSLERRIRKITYCGNTVYYYTKKNRDKFIIQEIPISKKEYNLLCEEKNSDKILKTRWYFNHNNLYFQYDEFGFEGDFEKYGILEVQTTDLQGEIILPEYFNICYEITGIKDLDNYHIAYCPKLRKNFLKEVEECVK